MDFLLVGHTIQKLKEDICAAVEVEIQNQINEYEISDEAHIAISHSAWGRFYSCAVQYHETGLVPMGLVVCNTSGLMVLIKKDIYSFVRPLETLEHLVLHEGKDNKKKFFHIFFEVSTLNWFTKFIK